MKKWSFGKTVLFLLIGGFVALVIYRKAFTTPTADEKLVGFTPSNRILHLEINGVILNGKKFIANLQKYKKNKEIKAVVIDVNSPGGAVGPSQEMYYEIVRFKNETGKPVVCVTTNLMASGGYYAALACDRIVVAPGAMVGSIGVVMEFANLEGLYDWAKVKRFTITSGRYKDSGAEFRPMRDDERQLFQDMIDEVYSQFKETVKSSRNLSEETINTFADGRVMTGATAVKLQFADEEGTFEDAVRIAAKMANLGDDYRVSKPQKEKENVLQMLFQREEEDSLNNRLGGTQGSLFSVDTWTSSFINKAMKTELLNRPLYLMPGYL